MRNQNNHQFKKLWYNKIKKYKIVINYNNRQEKNLKLIIILNSMKKVY